MQTVSVVIAAHNGEKYLRSAIESVLHQEYRFFDLWVMDNGSTDGTAAIAQSFPQVHYRYLQTANVALARNEGANASEGDYIAFLDQDDVWVPHKLSRQVAFLVSNTQHGAVIGQQQMFLEKGHAKPHWLKQEFLNTPQNGYLPSALMVRRSLFQEFELSLRLTSDTDWFFKMYDQGIPVGVLHEVLVLRRIHDENNSNHCTLMHKELLSILKDSIARKKDLRCTLRDY